MSKHKKIIIKDVKNTIKNGVEKLADIVARTLGPSGENIIINKSYGTPLITKDGVTVAKAVDLKGPDNMSAQILKQAALKTAEEAGDGTTTAIVLARGMFELNTSGYNPIDVKRGINRALSVTIDQLKAIAKECKDLDTIKRVATISANNDTSIGDIIAKSIESVGSEGTVTVLEGSGREHELELVQGMRFNKGYISPLLVNQNTMSAEFNNPHILIVDKKITSVQEISIPIEKILQSNSKPLLIIAEDLEGEALHTLCFNNIKGVVEVSAVKAPGFGDKRRDMLEDLAILTGAKIIGGNIDVRMKDFQMDFLGSANKISVTRDHTTIIGGAGDPTKIAGRVDSLKTQIASVSSNYEREQLQERISKLTKGIAVIKIGASTEVEMKEIKDRVDDALQASKAAIEEGIIPGGGIALLKISKYLLVEEVQTHNIAESKGISIVRRALTLPIRQMLINLGQNTIDEIGAIINEVKDHDNANWGYNVLTRTFGDMYEEGIIDPVKVTRCALQNAVSVAHLLNATGGIICEDENDNNNKSMNTI